MYSVDTGHFYSNHEKRLHDLNCKQRRERNWLKNNIENAEKELEKIGYSKEDLVAIRKGSCERACKVKEKCKNMCFSEQDLENIRKGKFNFIDNFCELDAFLPIVRELSLILRIEIYEPLIAVKREASKKSKDAILELLKERVDKNIKSGAKDHIRALREEDLNDNNVISVFESYLTRTIGIEQDELTDELLVVQVYYFDVFKDIMYHGFTYKGEKYIYYSSSAGQIRKKKAVFIKEKTWNRISKTIMCGLTIDKINEKGGNNANKHLAYLALSNSATDEWKEFDIDKTIVIEDFETLVFGTVDFIDGTDYSITRKDMDIPIPHTDGAGMVLPKVSTKNFMFRSPWIKGLLGSFDFVKFIQFHSCSPIIKDIYGNEHDIIAEDIQIIFTKSQFKMNKYYDSWDLYKENFKKYGCSAGVCNVEEERIKNAKINYQMLQTLTDITDDEINAIVENSASKIQNICNSKETMLEVLGVTPYNTRMTPFQKALKIYPTLLSDTYAKDVLRQVKNSLLNKYRSGKLEVKGKYTFVLPDFYAACEYWFMGIKNPNGLLNNGEVYCKLFKHSEELDCLRSPHLYREHAVRRNVACYKVCGERSDHIKEWFTTNGIYTSIHDMVSKYLMFDTDGDKLLCVTDKAIIEIAKKNMENVVPLYYDMKKANPTILTNENIYNGLITAFVGGNIGIYSNDISKIWNNDVFRTTDEDKKREAENSIKRLCCQNNFVIDMAKTLYKPEFPKDIELEIQEYTKKKLPAFFKYAKDKKDKQVEKPTGSFVNKIFDKMPDKPINTRGLNLGIINYKLMMSNPDMRCSRDVSTLYNELNKIYRYKINMKDEYIDNMRYIACQIREEFSTLGYSDETIADMLVHYLYGSEKRYKQLLWFCYGQYIVNNLEKNISVPKTKYIECIDCGEWIEIGYNNNRTHRCPKCQQEEHRRIKAERQKKYRKKCSK